MAIQRIRELASALLLVAAAIAVANEYALPRESPARLESVANPAAAGARLPRLAALPGGGVLMSWVESTPTEAILRYSVMRQGRWIRSGEVARGQGWFLNWADFPSVVAIDENFWVAHWQVGHPGGRPYDYDIAISISNDGGATWRSPVTPHRDGTAAEHGFVSIVPLGAGAGAIWLDGRDYVEAAEKVKHPDRSGNFSLRFARIERDGRIGTEEIVDADVCTCCQTAAVGLSGGLVAAWRGHTGQEIRDNLVSRWVDGKWSAVRSLGGEGWRLSGCPTNGPALSARGPVVAAAWFTGEGDRPRVRAAISDGSAIAFGSPVDIDAAGPIGRVGIAWVSADEALVSWIGQPDETQKSAPLSLRRLRKDGRQGPVERVAAVSAGRDSGVPQLVADDSCVVLAWTGSAPEYGVRTARLPVTTGICASGR